MLQQSPLKGKATRNLQWHISTTNEPILTLTDANSAAAKISPGSYKKSSKFSVLWTETTETFKKSVSSMNIEPLFNRDSESPFTRHSCLVSPFLFELQKIDTVVVALNFSSLPNLT
jgi:hypothetical protein